MKRLLTVFMVAILALAAAAAPAGAERGYLFRSSLSDNPHPSYPTTLKHGEVTIDRNFMVDIDISTDTADQQYMVLMEVGAQLRRHGVRLGTITTDDTGEGKARFDLRDFGPQVTTPRVIGPYFVLLSPGKPLPEFDTSYLVFTNTHPPSPGRIVVVKHTSPTGANGFPVIMSYGAQIGYPNGLQMSDGFEVDTEFTLAPGKHTITEWPCPMPGWGLNSINIGDPSGGSFVSGSTAVIDLAPGETVTVRLNNTQYPTGP